MAIINPDGKRPAPPCEIRGGDGHTYLMANVNVLTADAAVVAAIAEEAAFLILATRHGPVRAREMILRVKANLVGSAVDNASKAAVKP